MGDDALSGEMAEFMAASGIGTGHLRRIEGASIGLYLITLKDGERAFSYWPRPLPRGGWPKASTCWKRSVRRRWSTCPV